MATRMKADYEAAQEDRMKRNDMLAARHGKIGCPAVEAAALQTRRPREQDRPEPRRPEGIVPEDRKPRT